MDESIAKFQPVGLRLSKEITPSLLILARKTIQALGADELLRDQFRADGGDKEYLAKVLKLALTPLLCEEGYEVAAVADVCDYLAEESELTKGCAQLLIDKDTGIVLAAIRPEDILPPRPQLREDADGRQHYAMGLPQIDPQILAPLYVYQSEKKRSDLAVREAESRIAVTGQGSTQVLTQQGRKAFFNDVTVETLKKSLYISGGSTSRIQRHFALTDVVEDSPLTYRSNFEYRRSFNISDLKGLSLTYRHGSSVISSTVQALCSEVVHRVVASRFLGAGEEIQESDVAGWLSSVEGLETAVVPVGLVSSLKTVRVPLVPNRGSWALGLMDRVGEFSIDSVEVTSADDYNLWLVKVDVGFSFRLTNPDNASLRRLVSMSYDGLLDA